MSKDSLARFWASIDVKKMLLGLCTVVVSLVLYIGEMHMSRIEDNHQTVMGEIEKLYVAIKDEKVEVAGKFKDDNVQLKELYEKVSNLAVKIAQLEHLNTNQKR